MIQKLKIDESCIVFDTETTGLNPERDEIIQLNGKSFPQRPLIITSSFQLTIPWKM